MSILLCITLLFVTGTQFKYSQFISTRRHTKMASLQLCVLRENSIAHLDLVVYGVDSRCAKANAIVEMMLKYMQSSPMGYNVCT